MSNLLTYNLNDLDKTEISNINLKSIRSLISSINNNLVVKKCLGTSCGGTIYLINNIKHTSSYNKKIICKEIPLSSSITKPYIQKYYKLMQKVYNNIGVKHYINPLLEYKINKDKLYLLYPYYTGYNLEQLKKKMLKMDDENHKVIMKHLVKKILKGVAILHNQGVYHQKISPYNIIVNTDNKKGEIRVKFYDLSINNSINKKKTKKNKKNYTKKINKKYNKLIIKDCIDCGHLLLDLISFKYIEDYNNSNKDGILNKAMQFFNIKKKEREIEDIVDSDFVKYMKIINDKMIKNQENINKVLKEILLKEKYKD